MTNEEFLAAYDHIHNQRRLHALQIMSDIENFGVVRPKLVAGEGLLGAAGHWQKPPSDARSFGVVGIKELRADRHVPADAAEQQEGSAVVGSSSGEESGDNRRLLRVDPVQLPAESAGPLSGASTRKGQLVRTASNALLGDKQQTSGDVVQGGDHGAGRTSADATTARSQLDALRRGGARLVATCDRPMFDVADDITTADELEQLELDNAVNIDDDEPRSGEPDEYEPDVGSDDGCDCGEITLWERRVGEWVDPSGRFTVRRFVDDRQNFILLERAESDEQDGDADDDLRGATDKSATFRRRPTTLGIDKSKLRVGWSPK